MIKPNYCQFCEIYKNRSQEIILDHNELFFAFHDYDNATSQTHILICTNQHIQSAYHIQSASILWQMKTFAENILTKIYRATFQKQPTKQCFRLGFHVPPFISVHHIHLHAFILPFQQVYYDKVKYGFGPMFKSVDQISQYLTKRYSKL